jgi:O-antigen chain-terminating methyltransferase
MIEQNPAIDVDALMRQVELEVTNRRVGQPTAPPSVRSALAGLMLEVSRSEMFLRQAEERANARTKWPEKLDRFPFNLSDKVQRAFLKGINAVFSDQRVVNQNALQSLRESITLNRHLIQQLETLQSAIDNLRHDVERARALERHQKLQQDKIQANDVTLLDEFYVTLESVFRGSEVTIYDRLKVYLPYLEKAGLQSSGGIVLDVGCGRGEWLRLLESHYYKCRGVDLNPRMLAYCRQQGLDVIEMDALDYLKTLPDQSVAAITGFHIIEHIPFIQLIHLLRQVMRVLQPGGLAIFETPNPHNVLVGTNNFYIDPTHLNPLPSGLVDLLHRHVGFASTEVLNLHPYDSSFLLQGEGELAALAERFNFHFYGAQDYAVIGQKAIGQAA